MKRIERIACWSTPLLLLAAQTVHAHPLPGDAAGGFANGLLHPLLGADHLLAMVAVGVWAAQLGGAATWKVPLAFVATLLLGAAIAFAGIGLPLIEPMIAASVVVLGLLIGTQARLSPAYASLLVATFALFHGHAHMAELPATASVSVYVLGFALGTLLLHGTGIAAGYGLRLRASEAWLRAGGAGLAGVGVWLLAGI